MRIMCYRCFWPQSMCWCSSIIPMETRTRFIFLLHPKEYKQEKAATGRLTHLCLRESQMHMGVEFDEHAAVQAVIHDPSNYPVLVYPGRQALNFSTATEDQITSFRSELHSRRLVVFLLDATWSTGRKMLKLSPSLQRLPRVMFTPSAPSRYVIKQQPHPGCLSTLEATHELLVALERTGLDTYPLPDQLVSLFQRMQDLQIGFACDPKRDGYRRGKYKAPGDRVPLKGKSGARRMRVFQTPE